MLIVRREPFKTLQEPTCPEIPRDLGRNVP
jgi:hypothetical protein